jgi:hypothetical protein
MLVALILQEVVIPRQANASMLQIPISLLVIGMVRVYFLLTISSASLANAYKLLTLVWDWSALVQLILNVSNHKAVAQMENVIIAICRMGYRAVLTTLALAQRVLALPMRLLKLPVLLMTVASALELSALR